MDDVGSGMSNTTERVGYFTLPIVFFTGACTEREAKRRRWIRSDGEADGVEGSPQIRFLPFPAVLQTIDTLAFLACTESLFTCGAGDLDKLTCM